jgi:hypothetical protein
VSTGKLTRNLVTFGFSTVLYFIYCVHGPMYIVSSCFLLVEKYMPKLLVPLINGHFFFKTATVAFCCFVISIEHFTSIQPVSKNLLGPTNDANKQQGTKKIVNSKPKNYAVTAAFLQNASILAFSLLHF